MKNNKIDNYIGKCMRFLYVKIYLRVLSKSNLKSSIKVIKYIQINECQNAID